MIDFELLTHIRPRFFRDHLGTIASLLEAHPHTEKASEAPTTSAVGP